MKRIVIALALLITGTAALAQESKPAKKDWSKVDLSKRPADHFMLQFGYAGWGGTPDSIKPGGFSRSFNMYFLFDFPFKSNPKLSVAIGPGIGTDNIFFENTYIDIKNRTQAQFSRDTVNQYKKYKLQTGYLELPVEFRYSSKPENMNKSFKFAIGAKVGTTADAKTKAKVDLDENGDGGYIYKVKDKKFFNGTRIAAIGRLGYGNISLFGSYTFTELFKEGSGPQGIRPFTIGLCLSGL
jgi:Outer membrane protein beta-barrel domain